MSCDRCAALPRKAIQFVIVVFLDHTHLLILKHNDHLAKTYPGGNKTSKHLLRFICGNHRHHSALNKEGVKP